ncbi:hypothetical protein AHF37_09150 [Paragonimus kellicotti]|nr:hypothetical protein AHF37_09150 [Paragonimus kellicotti]
MCSGGISASVWFFSNVFTIETNRWEELKYPLRLKAWDCISKSWRGDPLCSNDGSVQPTHRFGHTVVAWRGRGWLFGGRTQQKVCSNQLYMFEPGTYHQTPSTDTTCSIHSSVANTGTNLAAQIIQPCWVEVVGLSGSAPSPRDGHAATVLENAMFIFGGFAVDSESFDDQIYRLDFETWSWTRIQIQPLSISATSSFSSEPAPSAADGIERLWLHTTPLARDFASLISHQGRLFMFGGRSGHTSHRENDVYDSTLWELVPLKVMTQTAEHSDRSYHTENSFTPAWPSDCSCCTSTIFHHPVAGLGHLRRMVWEAETGNWNSHRENDVYDSTLWELVPLKVMTQTAEHSDRSYHTENSFTPAWPSDCSCCTSTIFHHPVAGLGHLRRMVWEAETGNWNRWVSCCSAGLVLVHLIVYRTAFISNCFYWHVNYLTVFHF